MTKAARAKGFKGIAVDHSSERSCGVDICEFELVYPEQLESLLQYIRKYAAFIVAIWIAPSCGTASRARERPLPGGRKGPVPLRSLDRPDHIDCLSGVDKIKVEKANQLYDAVQQIAECGISLDICVATENPGNSHYWRTTPMMELRRMFGNDFVEFHSCAHGGTRDKLTAIWQSKAWFSALSLKCDGQHRHESWKPKQMDGKTVFPTSQEAAYPMLLCERVIDCIYAKVVEEGAVQSENLQQQMQTGSSTHQRGIAMGALPRGNKLQPLVSEFATYHTAICDPQQQPKQLDSVLKLLPKGARVTHRRLISGEVFRGDATLRASSVKSSDGGPAQTVCADAEVCETVEVCGIGVPGDAIEFLQKAVEAGHPRSLESHLDTLVERVVDENFHGDPSKLAKAKGRIEFFRKWHERAKFLDKAGENMLEGAPDYIRSILAGKRLTLWAEMLKHYDYPDVHLVEDVARGFGLTGWLRKSGVFEPEVKRSAVSRDSMLVLACGLNKSALKSMEKRQDGDLETGTWEETMSELERGWIFEDTSGSLVGKVVAKRFGLRRGEKLRVIDDCSIAGLNFSVGLSEKFQLHTIDQLAAMVACSLNRCGQSQHPKVYGRTYDLKSAYKQFPVSPEDRDILRLAVPSPDGKPRYFGVNALPFGAIGSVAGFLRISHSLWFLGMAGLPIFWTAFYDDCSVLTREGLQVSAGRSCEGLFKLLGIVFAESGKKAVPFSQCFKMLGLMVSTREMVDGAMTVTHTEERRAELRETIQCILRRNSLSGKEAERLRGWFSSKAMHLVVWLMEQCDH